MEMRNANFTGQARTESREVRRRQLIEATIDSIAKRGFSETTLAAVTNSVNLSHGIVNFHFKSKKLLFVETIGYLAEEHRAKWRKTIEKSGSSPQEKLLALVETDFHPNICNRKKLTVWFAFYGEPKYRALYRDKCAEIDAERLAETERSCRLIKAEGGYEHVDPLMFAQTLEAFIDGLWLNMLLYPKTFSRSQAKEECLAFLAATFPHHFSVSAKSQACMSK